MRLVLIRLVLLALGLGFGQMGLDSFARGDAAAVLQLGLAVIALIAGSAAYVGPLLVSAHLGELPSHD